MTTEVNLLIIACVIAVIIALSRPKKQSLPKTVSIFSSKIPQAYIYNYYKVPIDVFINYKGKDGGELIRDIASQQKKSIDKRKLENMSTIQVYQKTIENFSFNDQNLLGTAIINLSDDKAIKAIHCGMNSSQYDIAVSAEPTKSPLGSALPRVRIVNETNRLLRLNYNIQIPPKRAYLYFGEYQNGIPLGMILKDQDGILQDFVIDRPVTDIFMGLISDISLPLYDGAKIGNEFDDTTETVEFPFALPFYQYHKGVEIDKTYIPKNW